MNEQDNQQPSSWNGETHRICTKCGLQKPIEAFKLHYNGKYRRRSCIECDRPMFRQRHKEWRDANRDHVRAYAIESQKRHRKKWTPEKYEEMARKAVERREKWRRIVYVAYGEVCSCCGEDELMFLSIDHVNNDGYVRRKNGEGHGGEQLFLKIIKENFPPDFQLLCMNCNHGKARNGGVCPHQEKVQRLSGNGVEPSGSKPPALFCEEVKI